MQVYTTEEEQIAAIKKWVKENGLSVVGGVLIGLAILFGGKYWSESNNRYAEQASIEYDAMIQALQSNNGDEAAKHGELLLGQYADTPYAALAALAMAKVKSDKDETVAAKAHLRWAIDNTKDSELKTVAEIRFARLLLAEGKPDEALQEIAKLETGAYAALMEELKGDIYVAKGEISSARTSYTLALAALNPGSRAKNYLQIKLDNLGAEESPAGDS